MANRRENLIKTSQVPEQQSLEQRQVAVRIYPFLPLSVVSLAIFLDALDMSIVTIALPNIQRDLALNTAELQWVPGIYVLAYAGFQLLGGRAADLLGRRRIFLLGATLFGVASLTAGLAHIRINSSIERHPLLFDLDVCLTNTPRIPGGIEIGSAALLSLWCVMLHPAIDRRMINMQSSFQHDLFEIAIAQRRA